MYKQDKEFWLQRKEETLGETWEGSNSTPMPAFDYFKLNSDDEYITDSIYFTEDNWRDPMIQPFRTFVFDIIRQSYDKYNYDYVDLKDNPFHTKLTPRNKESNPWVIYVGNLDGQSVLCFYKKEFHEAFQLQQYKSRGRIESFHDFFEKDYPIDLRTFTDIYRSVLNV